jgi:hypothetical protein
MPIKEILQAIVFAHRLADNKDIEETINCVPDARMKDLEKALQERRDNGQLGLVQIGRMRKHAAPFTPYPDQVDDFIAKLDSVLPPLEFTGFDDVDDTTGA